MSLKSLLLGALADAGFSAITVGTHDGELHPDEVFAMMLLMMYYREHHGIGVEIIRSRDESKLSGCDVLVDVGGIYDPEKCRFDHHNIDGGVRENNIKFSSFGQVWKEIGLEICSGGEDTMRIVDRDLVQGIDALDNGQGTLNLFAREEDKFAEHVTVSSMIGNMNPTWLKIKKNPGAAAALYDSQFKKAVERAMEILADSIDAAEAEAEGLDLLKDAEDAPEIKVLEEKGIDGGNVVKAMADSPAHSEVKFLVFLAGNGEWSAQAVPPSRKDAFKQRVRFPEAWGWKRGVDLVAVSGVEGAIFCHGGGFFACAKTREGAIELANRALAKK